MSTVTQVEQVVEWMRDYARKHQLELRVYGEEAGRKDDWLYVPASVEAEDAYEEASHLQQIQDAWNNDEPPRQPRLMLVPTGDPLRDMEEQEDRRSAERDPKRYAPHQMVEWISDEAARRGWTDFVTVHSDRVREQDEWLYLPVSVDVPDVYERARHLQELEDAWNNIEPYRFPRLMIKPANKRGIDTASTPT